jgi:preprotein translocase subunit SecG
MPLAASWIYSLSLGLFITLFILISVLLILIVLIQKGRGGGLASAFGGGGGGNTAFGSKTGDVLTWATSIIFGVFLVIAVILNLLTRPDTRPVAATGSGTPAQQTTPSSTPDTNTPTPTTPAPTLPTLGDTATTPRPATNPTK